VLPGGSGEAVDVGVDIDGGTDVAVAVAVGVLVSEGAVVGAEVAVAEVKPIPADSGPTNMGLPLAG
jgi:hypothetical protein